MAPIVARSHVLVEGALQLAETLTIYDAVFVVVAAARGIPLCTRAAEWRKEMAQLHERLGDVLGLVGQHEAASQAYQSAEPIVPESDAFWRSRLRRKNADTCTVRRLYDDALEALASAEAALGPKSAQPSREWWQQWIEIQLARVHTFYYEDRVDEIADTVVKIRPILEAYGTPMQPARLSQSLLRMSLRRDRFAISEDALQYARDHVGAGEELGDPAEVAAARFDLGFALLWHGDLGEAEQEMAAARSPVGEFRIGSSRGLPWTQASCCGHNR